MPDQELKCAERDCTTPIIFTERDQEFYASQVDEDGNPSPWPPPKRCREHREAKKRRIVEREQSEGKA